MTTPRLDGIDTSHWQRITGRQPPLRFAIHKVSEGAKYQDPTFGQFVAHYRAQPHIANTGGYHWLRSDASVSSQVGNFLDGLRDHGGLRPGEFAMCDWERTYVNTTERQGAIMRKIRKAIPDPTPEDVELWCHLVGGELGHEAVAVYSAPWVTGFARWRSRNPHRALFLANYRTSKLLPYNGWSESVRWNATAWQYSSDGPVQGIGGRCDMNFVWQPEWFAALGRPTPQPPTTGDPDMAVLIRPDDGDVNVFAAGGGIATWVRSAYHLDELRLLGQVHGEVNPVPRGSLKALYLAGGEPTDGKTRLADFAGRA